MPPSAKQSPRPYLLAPQRRDQLLHTAGQLVRQGGWSALTMQGLAVATGVSRQLIYEHFAAADDLYLATLTHLFERAYASSVAVIDAGSSLEVTIRDAFGVFLDLPAEERHALRSLAAEADPGRRGLARAQARLRKRIAALYAPYIALQTGLPESESAAVAWMVNTAAWGLSDAVADGTVDRSRAVELFVLFVGSTLSQRRSTRP